MEREGLFGLMDDLRAGKPLPSLCDFDYIFARHRARKAAEADRDLVGERYYNAVVGSDDDSGGAYGRWLAGF